MVTDSRVELSLNAIFENFRDGRTLDGYIETPSRPQHEFSDVKRGELRRGRDISAASNPCAHNHVMTPA